MEQLKTKNLFDIRETLAEGLLENCIYPWEALPKLGEYISKICVHLNMDEYNEVEKGVFVHKTATIAKNVELNGPCIICANAELRTGAFIRGNAIIGEGATLGNSCEIKNAILCNGAQVPHFSYVGDSIIGAKAHLGAGAITSNLKSDKTEVTIKCTVEMPSEKVGATASKMKNVAIKTGLKKVGAFVGDGGEVGCNSVLCPGTVIGKNANVYPLVRVRGVVFENCILKDDGICVLKNKQ